MSANTIFITGGSSGIGKGLAEAFHRLGNRVIISGRRSERLRSICEINPGMRSLVLDVTDPVAVSDVAAQVIQQFPDLNCVINNAGIQRRLDFRQPLEERAFAEEIETNLLGVLRVTAAFLPHLIKRDSAVVVNVSSGLAFVPLAGQPLYCATKAAVHSLTLTLRHQLKDTGVRVVELIPPWVETELGGMNKTRDRRTGRQPMPLDEFIGEAIRELAGGADEVAVAQAKSLAAASCLETVKKVFESMN